MNQAEQLRETQRPIYEALRDFGPQTDEQIQRRLGKPANKVCPRRLELVKMGLVEEVGIGATSTGNKAKLWNIVPPERIVEAKELAAGRKERRKTILEAPLEDQVKAVQLLLRDDRVNAALMNLQGRAGERARGRARSERSAVERERREIREQIKDAEREQAAILHFLKLKRNLKDTEQVIRAVTAFIDADLRRARDYGEPLIPAGHWPDVRAHLSDVIDIATDTRDRLDVVTGESDADVIDVEAVEITELAMPDFDDPGGR